MLPTLSVTSRYRLQLLAEGPRSYRASDLNMLSLQKRGLVQRCVLLAAHSACGWELTVAGHAALLRATKTAKYLHALSRAYDRSVIGLSPRYPHGRKTPRESLVDKSHDVNDGDALDERDFSESGP